MILFPTQPDGSPARWKPVRNHEITGKPGVRSFYTTIDLIRQFHVETNPRYLRTPADTFCNIFVTDVLEAAGVLAPRHWSDPVSGMPTPVGSGEELSANKLNAWFEKFGTEFGWKRASTSVARVSANAGLIVVAVASNPNPKRSGHVAIVRPDESPELYVSQAGAFNFERARLVDAFGSLAGRVTLWVHE